MNTTKNISISRYILSLFAAIALLIGLTLSLSSCEKAPLSGEPVTVRFKINFSSFGAGEEITRSLATVAPETVVVPFGDLFMVAALEPDVPDTRAAYDDINPNLKVCVVVYETSSGNYVAHDVLGGVTVNTGTGALGETQFTLISGTEYTFVAFACNTVPSPTYFDDLVTAHIASGANSPVFLGIDPSDTDFLYGTETKIVSGTNDQVTIPIKHLFSRITQVVVTTNTGTPNITSVSNVSVVTNKANLILPSGLSTGITKHSAEITDVISNTWANIGGTPPVFAPNTTLAPFPFLVYPGNGITVNIGTVNLSGASGNPYSGSAVFNRVLASGTSYTMRVTFTKLPDPPVGPGTPLDPTYVGAFWKEDQIGERIIRIPVSGTNAGPWIARVTWLDGRWNAAGGDGILLDTLLRADARPERQISWVSVQTPLDAEGFKVTAGDAIISGTAAATGPTPGTIIFRIGLQTTGVTKDTYTKSDKWDATDTPTYSGTSYPARYAIVSLYYDLSNPGGPRVQNLFLRQGGFADYVMRPGDAGTGVPAGRPDVVRFSPYNLTAAPADMDGPVRNTWDASPNMTQPVAIFTTYPTQSGAFFQWANTGTRTRYAWNPLDVLITLPSWNTTTPLSSIYWDVLGATHESCPKPYRRPNDGIINGSNSAGAVAGSEFRQSLWKNPPSSTAGSTNSIFWGYYADGFFDRRQIVNSPTGATNSSVSTGNSDIAHVGQLFYNDNTSSRASLFFPAAGTRGNNDSELTEAGSYCYYWSSSVNGTNVWRLRTYKGSSGFSTRVMSAGSSVRCVRPAPAPELIDGIISDPWSGGDTDTKDQWVNW